jgi:hypothetical protein
MAMGQKAGTLANENSEDRTDDFFVMTFPIGSSRPQ